MKKYAAYIIPSLYLLLLTSNSLASPLLVSTDWLANKMKNKDIVLLDMSDSTQYSRFHLPGARHLPYNAINQRTKSGVSLSAGSAHISQVLGFLGISNNHHIVIYDDMAGLHAARLFWELERLGHKQVSILDGGLVKWILEGRKVTNTPTKFTKSRYQPNGNKRENLANIDDIERAKDRNTRLLDVRSKDEYFGHPRQKRSGHIPGALWWDWEQAGDFEQAFTMQPTSKLKKSLADVGLGKPDTPTILYCQSGHRAAHTYFTLRRLGYTNVRLYDGSMAEYSQQKNQPIRQGSAP